MTNKYTTRTKGFTLVELSIVIIIIGFLIAGIAAGQSLIKQAALNSVISDIQAYQTAYNSFILRYSEVPGDMPNAATYFSGCAETNTNCNGNGNGIIELYYQSYNIPDECYAAWKQLSLANLIYAGIEAIPDSWGGQHIIGTTDPSSKISQAGYIIAGPNIAFGYSAYGASISPWNNGITNAVFIAEPGYTSGMGKAALKAEDAFNIDKKLDDGVINGVNFSGSATGNFRSINDAYNGPWGNLCQNSGNYVISNTNPLCISGLALN